MTIATSGTKKTVFDGRKMWFIFGAIASAVVAILVFTLMSNVTRTENYYVLSKDVPARTLITQSMLQEVTVGAGSVPSTALPIGKILGGEDMYSLYPLTKGDVLTKSNIGKLLPLTQGLPSNFVVASFSAEPNNSAAGNIKRGDYIDIVTIAQGDKDAGDNIAASYVLQHVLVIDATVDLNSYDGSASGDSSSTSTDPTGITGNSTTTTTSGSAAPPSSQTGAIPMLYTVGLSQENALRLAVATKYDLFVVISSRDANEGTVTPNIPTMQSFDIWQGNAPDAGVGTDNTFSKSDAKPVRPGDKNNTPSEPTPGASDAPSTPDTSTDKPSDPTKDNAGDNSNTDNSSSSDSSNGDGTQK